MKKDLARCRDVDIADNEHGGIMLSGHFEYDDGSVQGLPITPDAEFLYAFMTVLGASKLGDVNGKSCWVTHDHERIVKIEPLHKDDGEPFDVADWLRRKELKLAENRKT